MVTGVELRENLVAVKKCVQRRGKIEQEVYLPRWQRWLYTVKAVVCILLNRWYDGEWDFADNYIAIAVWDGGHYIGQDYETIYWWEQIEVSMNWRDWRVIMTSDST